ncbi:apicoplast ribosomal protein S11, putative [Plasmodium reichenowi]|uniref:Apicoplast ribosomal protein S11, putative n=1 Tax=Plasmodium reichenowi TaxID=5854 RepID=A0A060S6I6_PLARE|nr:apicoplast ribosomal protein S11, putative [Plasmodium reichenowi]KYO03650.1 apicoplast ribosomal protein S11, putative [Plasmodium reichenowi]CDO67266.1 apicoplast ribosomal protein S11, putative [Plasmodium reichenowi]
MIKCNNYIIFLYFKLTLKNTLITISKYKYNNNKYIYIKNIKNISCGCFKYFKNRLKNTILANNILTINIIKYLINKNYLNINIIFNGINYYRIHILKLLLNVKYKNKKLNINKIFDITSIPYNGCKYSKRKY